MPDRLSQLLYAARWLGMLLVLSLHATVTFINFNVRTPQSESLYASFWRTIVSYAFGRQAVIGFFVMSGFLVGGHVLAQLRSDKPFLRDYFIHRFVRIYMVVIPATFLTFAFDTIGRKFFPIDYGAYQVFDGHFDPRYILTNLLNLQGVTATHYGTNGPLWSVGYEFWYYIIFPLLLAPLIVSLDKRTARICAALAALFCIAIVLRQIWFPFGLALWSLGAVVSLCGKPLSMSPGKAFIQFVSIGFLLGLVFNDNMLRAHPWVQYISDTVTAMAFANLILTMRFIDRLHWKCLDWSGHKTLADFSFTLYAIHNPTLMLLRATTSAVLGKAWMEGAATPVQWFAMAVAMSLTIALAYLLSRITEGKVGATRSYIKSLILKYWPDASAEIALSRR